MELRRHRRRQRDAHPVRAIGGARRLRQQHRHHGAEHIGDGRVVPRQRRHEARRGKTRLDDQRRAVQQRLEESVQGVGVEHRQGRHQHVALAHAEELAGIDGPPEILGVRAAHALGQAGRTGRVEDREGVAGLDRVRRPALLRRRERRASDVFDLGLCRFADQPQGFERNARTVQRREHRCQLALDDHEPRSAIARMCSSCAPREAVLMGTAMAPSQAQPRIVRRSSARLPHMRATRSPGLTPAAAKCCGVAGGRLALSQHMSASHPAMSMRRRSRNARPGAAACSAPCAQTGEKLRKRQRLAVAGRRAGEHWHGYPPQRL